jgi:hypothetical protein
MTVSMSLGIPLRGAVIKGKFEVLESNGALSIVGRPLVHAAELEKKQKWSGCFVSSSLIKYYQSFDEVVRGRKGPTLLNRVSNLLVPYSEVPLGDKLVEGYAINWTEDQNLNEENVEKAFSAYQKRTTTDETILKSIDLKIANTIKFYKYCQTLKKE